jgi:hypothetical protein
MIQVKIHNVRAGFATNSSSSHSIVMIPQGQREHTDEYERYSYNWEQFVLADADSKSAYFLTQMYQALQNAHLNHDEILHVMQGVLGADVNLENFPSEVGVDHQSHWYGMADSIKNTPDLVRSMFAFMQRDDVIILGGNDNGGDQEPPANCWQDVRTEMFSQFGDKRVRQDQGHWIMFNKQSGTKIRMSFDADSAPYVKSTVPELVDLKVTDYCSYGCAFCLVPGTQISTSTGIIPIEQITVGDEVLAYNESMDKIEPAAVAATYERDYEGDLFEIEMDNGVKVCITPEHEIFVKGKGWIQASLCEENDEILHIKEAG